MKKSMIILLIVLFAINLNAQHTSTQALSDNYRLLISFYSIGSGSDYQAVNQLKKFISQYNERHKVKIEPEVAPWGREGEVDYCFQLKGLKKRYQVKLIKEIQQLLKNAQHIYIEENKPCQHLRK